MYLCFGMLRTLRNLKHGHRVFLCRVEASTAPVWIGNVQKRNMSEDTYRDYFSSESPPIGFAQSVLENFHTTTGLPWWASLVLTTVAIRSCVTLPLQIYSNYMIAKVENLQPEIMDLSKRLKIEVADAVKRFKWDKKLARRKYNTTMKSLVRDLYIRENCHPIKASLVMWIQIPMWVSISFALRNMSGFYPYSTEVPVFQSVCPDLAFGGLLWFTDLTMPDTTWILPVLLGVSNLLIIEMQTWKIGGETKFQKILTNFLRGVSLIMIPIGASVPSCMCLYWVSSSLFGFAQNILFKFPRVRRAVGIPITPSESSTPIKDMLAAAKTKYTRKKTD